MVTSRICCSLTVALLLCMAGAAHAQVANQRATLTQYVTELQKNPNDYALRERIIKLAQAMNPPPPLPEEARQACIEGQTLFKMSQAKDGTTGFALAADAYRQCLLIAPWFSEGYNNYALALDAANRFDEAIAALRLYIVTAPGDAEVRRAQDKIYEIGAKKKLTTAAARAADAPPGSSAPGTSSTPRSPFDALMDKIEGRRYTSPIESGMTMVIDVKGRTLVYGTLYVGVYSEKSRLEVHDREVKVPNPRQIIGGPVADCTIIISEDGLTLTQQVRYTDGDARTLIYRWQR